MLGAEPLDLLMFVPKANGLPVVFMLGHEEDEDGSYERFEEATKLDRFNYEIRAYYYNDAVVVEGYDVVYRVRGDAASERV
jgi:hypothetical protein